MKPPLRKPRRKRKANPQMEFNFPVIASTPRPPKRNTPFTESTSTLTRGIKPPWTPSDSTHWDFEPGKPTRVITRDCLDHLANSQIFSAVADDPRPTGSGE